MDFITVYLFAGFIILLLMTSIWGLSLRLKDSSIVDVVWGSGFVLTAWLYFFNSPQGYAPRQWLILALVTLWGGRLSLYLLWRNWGHGEDYRYQQFRHKHGDAWWWQSYIKVFLLQGTVMWFLSLPLLAAQISPMPSRLTLLDFGAIILWTVGFFFEAVGDGQLARFKANPIHHGKLLTTGLWRYTRHPNYFGDATQWWGFYLIALAAGGWWTIISPLLMTYLLLRISGVALLERTLQQTKPHYETYQQNTSAFLPWWPKQ